jgi:hypothetical protein
MTQKLDFAITVMKKLEIEKSLMAKHLNLSTVWIMVKKFKSVVGEIEKLFKLPKV